MVDFGKSSLTKRSKFRVLVLAFSGVFRDITHLHQQWSWRMKQIYDLSYFVTNFCIQRKKQSYLTLCILMQVKHILSFFYWKHNKNCSVVLEVSGLFVCYLSDTHSFLHTGVSLGSTQFAVIPQRSTQYNKHHTPTFLKGQCYFNNIFLICIWIQI